MTTMYFYYLLYYYTLSLLIVTLLYTFSADTNKIKTTERADYYK